MEVAKETFNSNSDRLCSVRNLKAAFAHKIHDFLMFIIFGNINSKLACSCGNSKIFEKKICVSFRWSMLDVNCVFVVLIIDIFSAL